MMRAETATKRMRITGWVLSGIAIAFLGFDVVVHVIKHPAAVTAFNELGWPLDLLVPIGILELACLALYCIPRTSVLGAILMTGYLGGAVATNLRVGKPLLGYVMFPVYVGLLLWGGLWLRDARLRGLMPTNAPPTGQGAT
jgi:hypothetical protein